MKKVVRIKKSNVNMDHDEYYKLATRKQNENLLGIYPLKKPFETYENNSICESSFHSSRTSQLPSARRKNFIVKRT